MPGVQDADLALARTLQEQERAFMLFAAHQQQHEHQQQQQQRC